MDHRRHPRVEHAPLSEEARANRLSRFLALVLRHRAHEFDLKVDDEGFVSIEALLDVIRSQNGMDGVVRENLEAIAREGDRRRYEISGDFIRATYGHSFRRPIRYQEVAPPDRLFVSVPTAQIPHVRVTGLRPEDRQYLHLSGTEEEAREIGDRRNVEHVVVTVLAGEAAVAGIPFHRPTEGLYLTTQLPPRFLEIEMQYGRSPRKAKRRH
jgi:putative RNA 2'-phosphotransferase